MNKNKKTKKNKNGKNNYTIKYCLIISILLFFIIIYFKNAYLKSKLILLKEEKTNSNFTDFKFNKFENFDAVLLMAPHHGNLGDQAITLAEIKFLNEIFPNITLIYNLENYKEYIHNNTIIFLQGGGNLGWTYKKEEKNRRKIIKSYPNNNIIILPQTSYFDKSKKNQQKISTKIYSNHSKLIIITREKVSFNIAKNIFPKNKILLSPDIVSYLDDLIDSNNIIRKGALVLLRKDREKYLNKINQNKIISIIKINYDKYELSDNIFKIFINSLNESKEKVLSQLKYISNHEIVITDRLHGMIFSAITQTSCIVIKNYNHKLSASYEWFKSFDYIKMINNNDINHFQTVLDYFKNKKTKNIYDKSYFEPYYKIIRETIFNLNKY